MAIEQVLHMNGGDGHASYANNSTFQTPDDLAEAAIVLLNKGAIYLSSTGPPAAHKAYIGHFKEDFTLFLRSRSSELLPGGAMVRTFIGRDESNELLNAWVIIGTVLKDMAAEIPSYCPAAEEVRQVIQEEGSFDIQRLETIRTDWVKNIGVSDDDDPLTVETKRAEAVAKDIKAVAEPTIESQFGEDIMDELFRRFKNKILRLYGVEKLELANLVMHITTCT